MERKWITGAQWTLSDKGFIIYIKVDVLITLKVDVLKNKVNWHPLIAMGEHSVEQLCKKKILKKPHCVLTTCMRKTRPASPDLKNEFEKKLHLQKY